MEIKPNEGIIYDNISDLLKNIKIYSFDTVESTNTLLKEYAENGAPEGTTVLSFSQRAGRGRYGRTFFSPKGTGIYLSTLIRPRLFEAVGDKITSVAAVAICEAIEAVFPRLNAEIKWVNDIYVDSKKVCGILAEASFTENGALDYVVLGAGINVFQPKEGFPDEINYTAGYLSTENKDHAIELLSAELLSRFYDYYKRLPEASYQKKYAERCFLIGKTVDILRAGAEPDEAESALVTGIDDNCGLIVKFIDGRTEILTSGEVRVRGW